MDWILPLVAFFAALLTFFSGFGLGTLLMAVLLCYYPAEIAIVITALVHLGSSLLKVLLNRSVRWDIVLRFGVASVLAALLGSELLEILIRDEIQLYSISVFNRTNEVGLVNFIIGLLLMVFAAVEWSYKSKSMYMPLWLGGIISGFFGGFSGHQGALRSVFLVQRIREVPNYIATTAFISLCVDAARVANYSRNDLLASVSFDQVVWCLLAALGGVLLGTFLIKKTTLRLLQNWVAISIFLLGVAMLTGLV
jgi:uncharacterized membrane protein YfcA